MTRYELEDEPRSTAALTEISARNNLRPGQSQVMIRAPNGWNPMRFNEGNAGRINVSQFAASQREDFITDAPSASQCSSVKRGGDEVLAGRKRRVGGKRGGGSSCCLPRRPIGGGAPDNRK